ncbi:hypothetical protein EVAR_6611_1 [Eumeta japonica]|uniref:Uncharacterized protein n=1 Tax=Eumeta variegata TaxID=151549 RepID=A0A4C1TK61_EUMVA|nr:hypothetical protein EVAR_6611_1 [Eumeta japonica]
MIWSVDSYINNKTNAVTQKTKLRAELPPELRINLMVTFEHYLILTFARGSARVDTEWIFFLFFTSTNYAADYDLDYRLALDSDSGSTLDSNSSFNVDTGSDFESSRKRRREESLLSLAGSSSTRNVKFVQRAVTRYVKSPQAYRERIERREAARRHDDGRDAHLGRREAAAPSIVRIAGCDYLFS